MSPQPLTFPVALLLSLALGGCVPVARVITIERSVWQSAATLPPAGPVGVGPLAEPDAVSLEVEAWTSPALDSTPSTRASGAPGHLQALGGGQLRLLGRLDESIEAGLSLELSPSVLSNALASDLPTEELDSALLFRTGPHLRIAAPLSPTLLLEFQGDLRLSRLKVDRDLRFISTETAYTVDGVQFSGDLSWMEKSSTYTPFTLRGGMGLGWRPDADLHLSLGAMMQNAAFVEGYRIDRWTCVEHRGETLTSCEGPDLPKGWSNVWIGTLYLGAGQRVGQGLWLLPRAWWHMLPDEEGLAEAAPFGAGLAIRTTLR